MQAGHTPLAVAIKNNRLEVAAELLQGAKCDPNKVAFRVHGYIHDIIISLLISLFV